MNLPTQPPRVVNKMQENGRITSENHPKLEKKFISRLAADTTYLFTSSLIQLLPGNKNISRRWHYSV